MKLRLNKNSLRENIAQLMRRAGYRLNNHGRGELNFWRPLSGGAYPRFHAYIYEEAAEIVINLHLDQKHPSYAGSHAHSGEYDGELVKEELARINSLI